MRSKRPKLHCKLHSVSLRSNPRTKQSIISLSTIYSCFALVFSTVIKIVKSWISILDFKFKNLNGNFRDFNGRNLKANMSKLLPVNCKFIYYP